MLLPETASLAASMVKAELEKSGKIPKIEHGKELGVLKWDGDTTGLEYLEAYGLFRISDTPIPTETIKGIKILVHDESMIIVDENGYTVISSSGESATNPNVTLQVSEYGPIHLVGDTTNSMLYAMSVTDDYTDDETGLTIPKGFYLLCSENGYVSEVNSVMMETETIHPIDQKYLPGGSIRMDAYGNSEMTVNDALLNLALEGGGTTTFASGMEPFWADVLAKQPDYLIFNVGDNLRMPICVLYATEGSVRSGESCISANGLLSLYGTNLLGYFVMAQTKDGKGVKISVKSELVIFPETALAEHGGE